MTLRVRLEIVPFGDESRTREIGRLDIFNKGLFDNLKIRDLYKYGVIDLSRGSEGLYIDEVLHERTEGAWALVRTVLTDLDVLGPK